VLGRIGERVRDDLARRDLDRLRRPFQVLFW
jgi:hypothetical protein